MLLKINKKEMNECYIPTLGSESAVDLAQTLVQLQTSYSGWILHFTMHRPKQRVNCGGWGSLKSAFKGTLEAYFFSYRY